MHCRDCGATVERTDRFCPACGTPNADTKFHPKFAPLPKAFEAEILYELAAADEPSCLRCERRIDEGARWCEGCGLDLRESWSRHRHRVAVDRWERGETVPRPFRPSGRTGRGLRIVVVVATVTALAVAVAGAELGIEALPAAPADRMALVAPVGGGLAVVVAVLLLAWSRRALRNLPALGIIDRRRRRVRDVVQPRRVLDDLWRTSAADVPVCSPAWRVGRGSRLALLWWGSLLLGAVLVVTAAVTVPSSVNADWLAGAAALVLAASLVALLALVRRIDERQSRRAAAVLVRDVSAPVEQVSVELTATVPTRLEALRTTPGDRGTTALPKPPSSRRPVWGKY